MRRNGKEKGKQKSQIRYAGSAYEFFHPCFTLVFSSHFHFHFHFHLHVHFHFNFQFFLFFERGFKPLNIRLSRLPDKIYHEKVSWVPFFWHV